MITNRVLIDTGPLVAIFSASDQYHQRCIELAKELVDQPLTCWPALTEAAYLLRNVPGAVASLLSRIEMGAIAVLPLTALDIPGITAILEKYRDQKFDFADACLMHLTNRESIEVILTVDRRHFSIFQTVNGRNLTLLPEF